MGDGLKLSKDKRHRSSSSIAGAGLEGTRSERKLDIRALIPEVDDHFAVAESRCDDLQEKIDLVKVLKRKKKLNKRSMTRVNEAPTVTEDIPFITVRTKPKKRLMVTEVSQHATRMRQLVPPNPVRGYIDPATVEQHRMLGQVWGYGQNYNHHQNEYQTEHKPYSRTRTTRRNRADGDGMCGQALESSLAPVEIACGQDDDASAYSDIEIYDQAPGELFPAPADSNTYSSKKSKSLAKRNESVDGKSNEEAVLRAGTTWKMGISGIRRRVGQHQQKPQQQLLNGVEPKAMPEERSVVELFNKSRITSNGPPYVQPTRPQSRKEERRPQKRKNYDKVGDQNERALQSDYSTESIKKPVRRKTRHRNYELPTVASQLKQVDARYHCSVANRSNIPFVVSKSTAPSHNIGVNIQQVLNGVKMQQPLNGIPLTIAHHMGLGHVPTYNTKKPNKQAKPSLNKSVINAITLGKRLLMLPSYRTMSYNRLLTLYSDGDGMVPRFLRAISRPNYLYTSMYDLQAREEQEGAASSRGRGRALDMDDETKRRLAEYAQLYDEYDRLETQRKQPGHASPDVDRRCEELLRELLTREELFKKVSERESMPRRTATTTTLISTGAETSERYACHPAQLEDNMSTHGFSNYSSKRLSTGAISDARRTTQT